MITPDFEKLPTFPGHYCIEDFGRTLGGGCGSKPLLNVDPTCLARGFWASEAGCYWYWYLSNLGQNSLYSILIDTKYPKVQHWNCHFFDFQNQNKNEQNDTISGKVWALKFKKYLTWTNFWIVHYNLSKIKFLFH